MENLTWVKPGLGLVIRGAFRMIKNLFYKKFPMDLDKLTLLKEQIHFYDDEELPNVTLSFDLINRTNDNIRIIGFSVMVSSESRLVLNGFSMVTKLIEFDRELNHISFRSVLGQNQASAIRKAKEQSRSIDIVLDFHLAFRDEIQNHEKRFRLLVG